MDWHLFNIFRLADLPDPPTLEYGMIYGMVEAYGDRYTRFVEPVQHELATDNLEGNYGGIGARLDRDAEGFIIFYPFPDGAAKAAGMQDGDRLIKVDDLEITMASSFDEAIAAIRGPVGEKVTIEILRPPIFDRYSFSIPRDNFPIPSVTWNLDQLEKRLGIIKINLIGASTADEILAAYEDLQTQGATHFALDFRGNGGGYLESGVDISELFLEDGIIYQEAYRGQEIDTYRVKKPGPLSDIPLVVLVDQNSASATELIAGALQAHERAPLIGTITFGKDSIQLIFELEDESSLHVTAAKWWVPGLDTSIGENGLQPDIQVSTEAAEGDPFIQAAVEFFFSE